MQEKPIVSRDNPHATMKDVDAQFDEVVINGKTYEPNKMNLTYGWIVKTAFGKYRKDYTVTFKYTKEPGSGGTKDGILQPGKYIAQKDGLIINVANTCEA